MTDIHDDLRALIVDAKLPGMYTPSERQSFASHWIGIISPQRLTELLDEIERLREKPDYPDGGDARDAALEEAAKLFDNDANRLFAQQIRALKDLPDA